MEIKSPKYVLGAQWRLFILLLNIFYVIFTQLNICKYVVAETAKVVGMLPLLEI